MSSSTENSSDFTKKTFDLTEEVQLDQKSWLRIFIGVFSFILIWLIFTASLAFTSGFPRTLLLFVCPVAGIIIFRGTFFIALKILKFFNLAEHSSTCEMRLSAKYMTIHRVGAKSMTVENQNLRHIRTTGSYLEIESPQVGTFQVPLFVRFKNESIPDIDDIGDGKLALRLIKNQLCLVIWHYDSDDSEVEIINF